MCGKVVVLTLDLKKGSYLLTFTVPLFFFFFFFFLLRIYGEENDAQWRQKMGKLIFVKEPHQIDQIIYSQALLTDRWWLGKPKKLMPKATLPPKEISGINGTIPRYETVMHSHSTAFCAVVTPSAHTTNSQANQTINHQTLFSMKTSQSGPGFRLCRRVLRARPAIGGEYSLFS